MRTAGRAPAPAPARKKRASPAIFGRPLATACTPPRRRAARPQRLRPRTPRSACSHCHDNVIVNDVVAAAVRNDTALACARVHPICVSPRLNAISLGTGCTTASRPRRARTSGALGKPRRVRRAVRARRHRACHGGRRVGRLCAEGALSGLRHSRTATNSCCWARAAPSGCPHALRTRDLLTIIHLLPRKAGRCDAAPLLALFAAGETAKALAIGMALFCWRAAHDGWARRTVTAHSVLE